MRLTGFANVQCSLGEFVEMESDHLVGQLANGLANSGFESVSSLQLKSWCGQVEVLQVALKYLISCLPSASNDTIILEYTIPVIRRRIDAIIIHEDKIIVIEYKHGTTTTPTSALRQAQDYSSDLADFQEFSREAQHFPLAIGEFPKLKRVTNPEKGFAIGSDELTQVLLQIFEQPMRFNCLQQSMWASGRYFPVPKVVEAAVAAFNGNKVKDLAISRADPGSLERSQKVLIEAVAKAKQTNSKILCVLTGVPGAGKTLAGLNAVSEVISELHLDTEQATYLSGNTPLVNVLREALYRDRKARGEQVTKAKLEVLIQEMHRFVADNYEAKGAPAARMIVFDEAQRAWSRTRNFRKFGRDTSEPTMVFEIMNRHVGWAVIVALVGGGQEIHDGEAGLEEWGDAIDSYPNWSIWASPAAINGGPAVAGSRLFPPETLIPKDLTVRNELHLDVSLRSIDAEESADWVNAMLDGRQSDAENIAQKGLPIYRCRSIKTLRSWLENNRMGTRSSGLVASSAAERLRAIGIETPTFSFVRGIDYVKWFLEPAGDVRSSNQLEVALSEFEVQGLEIDYVGLLWGGDLLFDSEGPMIRKFSGSNWQTGTRNTENPEMKSKRSFQEGLNRYRVLLTRYRKAMVICVPTGDENDETRNPREFDSVFEYLGSCGISALDE